MTIETLTRAIRRTPFIPFTLHLADGRQFTISHPETIAHGGRTAVIFAGPDQVEEIEQPWLRWFDDRGRMLPTGAELALLERRRTEQERQRADAEHQRAERLAAQLRALGVEPEA